MTPASSFLDELKAAAEDAARAESDFQREVAARTKALERERAFAHRRLNFMRAIADADLVLAIYNPASRTRSDQIAMARKILLEHRSADTIVVVGRDVGRDDESLTVTTLGDLDTDAIDMKCLLLVGASATRTTSSGRVWTPRWVR